MFARAVAVGVRAGAAVRVAVRRPGVAAVRCMGTAGGDTAEFNADVNTEFPRFPVWGPRVPVEVSETYEEDSKNFFEQHWDEVVDLDTVLRKTASELVETGNPADTEGLDIPHPKATLAVTDATEKYFDKWMEGASGEQRILVPLCGGWSAEMGAFAAMGHRVVGVDYVRAAVDALAIYEILPDFQEEGWRENFLIHHSPESGAIVAEGDFFNATPEELGTFDRVFERSGITSVPQSRQAEYAKVLHSLMKPGAKMLMETMSAGGDESYAWSTPEALAKIFKAPEWKLEELETQDVTNTAPYSDTQLTDLKLHNFLVTRV